MGQEVTETKQEKKNELVLNLSTEPLITFNEKKIGRNQIIIIETANFKRVIKFKSVFMIFRPNYSCNHNLFTKQVMKN